MPDSILVTGGAGYVGSHACKALARAGYRPVVYDNLSRGHREAVRWGPLVEGDLNDMAQLVAALEIHQVTAIMHFAAFAYVGESVEQPETYYRNNVGGTLALLAAMRKASIGTIVFSSTCAVYGTPDRLPIGEATEKSPLNPYGETKLAIERALRWYGAAYGIRYAALRYFNAAGADPESQIGEDHEPETHLIPRVLRAALGTGDPVEVYGTDYPTPDGTAIRDYIHVTDLAHAHVRALGYLAAGGESAALNLGTGQGCSVRQVIAAVERISGRPVPFREAPRRPGDPPELVADPALARARLGWQPQHSDLDTIIRTALAWEQRSVNPQPAA
ncbi:MAG: UDP-glucose 4-epimerase GalE [Alphaproteobacteria bacterium]|nr:UDP-glucose 4-epimerase GalE [Alphaproteobacteria bacterium]